MKGSDGFPDDGPDDGFSSDAFAAKTPAGSDGPDSAFFPDAFSSKGHCVLCNMKTHEALFGDTLIPLTNENVFQGTCIKCNPQCLPKDGTDAGVEAAKQKPTPAASPAKNTAKNTEISSAFKDTSADDEWVSF